MKTTLKTSTVNPMELLKAKAIDMNSGIKLAKDRVKTELPMKTIMNINNFEFSVSNLDGKELRFVALTCSESDEEFYFGGSVVTDAFYKFTEEELFLIRENGIPVIFEKVVSKVKGHNDYTKVIFFPEEA